MLTRRIESEFQVSEAGADLRRRLEGGNSLAPVPRTIGDTGLSRLFLADLLAKHLYAAGDLNLKDLSRRMALSWQVIEALVAFLREGALVEVRRGMKDELSFRLTDKGRAMALEAMVKDSYVGAAPVTLDHYIRLVKAQSVLDVRVDLDTMRAAYRDAVIEDEVFDVLGPAIMSGRAMFLYGDPGTGKTFVAQRIARLMEGEILIPHAVTVADKIVAWFDPVVHKPGKPVDEKPGLVATDEYDPRFVRCRRPEIVVGGELTLDMLELGLDAASKVYQAPLHLKANNGVFVIDDLGRQRVRAMDIFNRWIIPMEEKRDFMTVGSGTRFEVPLDLVLAFSTNMNPRDLADEAFLRRLGYKLRFKYCTETQYRKIWDSVCERLQMDCGETEFRYVVNELYKQAQLPMLPCHPRDLLGLVADQCRYHSEEFTVTRQRLEQAWQNYFVRDF